MYFSKFFSWQASIEAVLGAPVVITAFAAALFGGILSPLISEGLSRMSDYQVSPAFSDIFFHIFDISNIFFFQIEWPSIGSKDTRRRRKKVTSKCFSINLNFFWRIFLTCFSWQAPRPGTSLTTSPGSMFSRESTLSSLPSEIRWGSCFVDFFVVYFSYVFLLLF